MKRIFITSKSLLMAGVLLALLSGCGGGGGSNSSATYDVDALGVPKFVSTNYIELTQKDGGDYIINKISRFRSSDGHDFSSFLDHVETCRSMKHYFKTPNLSTKIYSPVDGVITRIQEEEYPPLEGGTQIDIRSDSHPAFKFTIFHIKEDNPFTLGQKVAEGERLGTHASLGTVSDIAVYVNTPTGYRLVSYFETLTSTALTPFTDRYPGFLADVIITEADRNDNPLTCSGDAFIGLDLLPKTISF